MGNLSVTASLQRLVRRPTTHNCASLRNRWRGEIAPVRVLRRTDQPFSLFLYRHPGEYAFARLARRAVRVFVAFEPPGDVDECDVRPQELNVYPACLPDTFNKLVQARCVLSFDLFPPFPAFRTDIDEVGIFGE